MSAAASTFIWYDLLTSDPDAAEAFYARVVGWTAEPWAGPGPRYTVVKAGGRGVAGLMGLPDAVREAGGRPAWLGYLHAPDIDATVARIRDAGGAIHREPADIPGVGRFAVVADPQGATFQLLAPSGEAQPPAALTEPGHVGWHELYARDWESAFAFYAAEFGWTKDRPVDMGPMGTYQLFAAGREAIGGMMNKPDVMPVPVWGFYFNVDAIDAAAARVAEHGGQVRNGPHEVPGGMWIVNCADPQGAGFSLVAPQR